MHVPCVHPPTFLPMGCAVAQDVPVGRMEFQKSLWNHIFYAHVIVEVPIMNMCTCGRRSGQLLIRAGVSFIWANAMWFNWQLLGETEGECILEHIINLRLGSSRRLVFLAAVKVTKPWNSLLLWLGNFGTNRNILAMQNATLQLICIMKSNCKVTKFSTTIWLPMQKHFRFNKHWCFIF